MQAYLGKSPHKFHWIINLAYFLGQFLIPLVGFKRCSGYGGTSISELLDTSQHLFKVLLSLPIIGKYYLVYLIDIQVPSTYLWRKAVIFHGLDNLIYLVVGANYLAELTILCLDALNVA